jgi:hypothetical protein
VSDDNIERVREEFQRSPLRSVARASSVSGTEQPHAQIEHQRDSPKANVFRAVSREKMHGPFFFTEAMATHF